MSVSECQQPVLTLGFLGFGWPMALHGQGHGHPRMTNPDPMLVCEHNRRVAAESEAAAHRVGLAAGLSV